MCGVLSQAGGAWGFQPIELVGCRTPPAADRHWAGRPATSGAAIVTVLGLADLCGLFRGGFWRGVRGCAGLCGHAAAHSGAHEDSCAAVLVLCGVVQGAGDAVTGLLP